MTAMNAVYWAAIGEGLAIGALLGVLLDRVALGRWFWQRRTKRVPRR
ncbi:hypothetical protein [Propionivibrio soli]|nr:hypothetical protein [Propionivibrio soli]